METLKLVEEYFSQSEILDCDCYVADYTDQTHNRRGVEISVIPFEDIDYFHLKKKHKNQNIPYLAVNLEHYPAFTKGIENCECIFYSMTNKPKSWVLLLETKYCQSSDKIEEYQTKTVHQMAETLRRMQEMEMIDEENYNIYFAYSVPTQSAFEPFYPFSFSFDFILQLREKGIKFYGYNNLLIATPQYLQIPYKTI